jgi:hypothetical protein
MKSVTKFLQTLIPAIFMMTTACAMAQENSGTPFTSKEFNMNGPGRLHVETSGGGIFVSGRGGNQVKVEMFVRKGRKELTRDDAAAQEVLENYDIDISQSGNTITATAERRSSFDGWFGGDNTSISFNVYVPEQMSANLNTSGGSIQLEGVKGVQLVNTSGGSLTLLNIEGNMEAQTSGGSITIEDYKGILEAGTSGGSIKMQDAEGNLKVRTSGGNIRLDKIKGSVDASTSGGGIEANLLTLNDDVTLKTSGGSIHATVPKGLGLDLDLEGNRVNTQLQNFNGEAEKDRVRGSMNGGGIAVVMSTSGGSVNLDYQ